MPAPSLDDRRHVVAAHRVGVGGIVPEAFEGLGGAVEAVEAVDGAEPDRTAAVLEEAVDLVGPQAVLVRGIMDVRGESLKPVRRPFEPLDADRTGGDPKTAGAFGHQAVDLVAQERLGLAGLVAIVDETAAVGAQPAQASGGADPQVAVAVEDDVGDVVVHQARRITGIVPMVDGRPAVSVERREAAVACADPQRAFAVAGESPDVAAAQTPDGRPAGGAAR